MAKEALTNDLGEDISMGEGLPSNCAMKNTA